MLHPPKTVRITEAGKASLSRIKKQSGILHWNTLCRLALARSLADPAPPASLTLGTGSALDIDWSTFAGDWGDLLWALLLARLAEEGATMDAATAHERLRQHLHRGIHQLATLDGGPEALLPSPALPAPAA